MTGSEVEWSVFSPLTLAYFADSGWYQIDDTKAQALIWGKNQVSGIFCDFWDFELR